MGYLICVGVGIILGFSSGRNSMAREYNAAGNALRKMLTGKD